MQERSTMSPNIRPAHPVFAGDVSAIDISQKLSQEQVAAIEAGMDRYAVLVFRDQQLTDDQQLEFSRNFGELEVTLAGQMAKPEDRRLGDRLELGDISNLTAQNELRAREDRSRMYALANRLWHSDASFRAVGAGYTLLHGRVIPQKGGNTEFADMRAAYDALDASMKAQVESLVCEHSIVFSREQIGFSDYAPGNEERLRPVQHRLVITHPVSGRKSLYLSSHIGGIVGWPIPEARAFIRDLMEHATQRQFVYAHEWRVNDLVMWDNRTVMHRARPFNDLKEVRDLRRTSIKGTGLMVEAAPAQAA
jgi:alpha-ketoglutarate-dependent 2,4-dichlorophenoxyacetate dioxygenase